MEPSVVATSEKMSPPNKQNKGLLTLMYIYMYSCWLYIYLQHPFGDNFPHVGFQLRLEAIEIG